MRGRGGRDGHNTRKNTYTRRHEGVNAKNTPAHCFVLIWFEAVHNIIHLLYALHVYDSIWPNMQTLNIHRIFFDFCDFSSFILLAYWFLMSPKEHKRICQCLVSIFLVLDYFRSLNIFFVTNSRIFLLIHRIDTIINWHKTLTFYGTILLTRKKKLLIIKYLLKNERSNEIIWLKVVILELKYQIFTIILIDNAVLGQKDPTHFCAKETLEQIT